MTLDTIKLTLNYLYLYFFYVKECFPNLFEAL